MKNAELIRRPIIFIIVFLSASCLQKLFCQPVISSFSPASGSIGTSVTISGTNFDTNPANNIVYFGAVRSTVSAANDHSLTVTVPTGATFEPISVTVAGLTAYSSQYFLVTFAGSGTGFLPGSFASKIDYSAGTYPSGPYGADFDGDGKVDIAVANTRSNTISVFKNNSSVNNSISFAAGITYATAAQPANISVADFDGDGRRDIVTPNYGSNTLSVFRNTSTAGSITFSQKFDFVSGTGPVFAAAGDLDNDGKADVVVVNGSSNTFSVLRNTSSGSNLSFAQKTDFNTGTTPEALVINDFDGDGRNDVAVVNYTSNSISVFRNNVVGNVISFEAKVDYRVSYGPFCIAAGDLDSDGKFDLIAGNWDSANFSVLKNNSTPGNIAFSSQVWFSSDSQPASVALNDLDGDGNVDIVTGNYGSNTVAVFKNMSSSNSISFASKASYTVGTGPQGVFLADVDADGMADITVANSKSNTISILRNKTTVPNSPGITSFSPRSGGNGTEITIAGYNLNTATGVSFGGTPAASFAVVSNSTIKAIVGTGATGSVSVTTQNGTASSEGFIFIPRPVINSITPSSAATGTTVTINGSNFTGANKVNFGVNPAASFTIVSSSTINAIVGAGATGNVYVATPGGTDSIQGFVFLPAPVVTSFTPKDAAIGSLITIIGENFSGVTAVNIGDNPASSFKVISTTTIEAFAGTISGGPVSVTTAGGKGSLAGFYNGVSISSFSPEFGPVGTTVVINGTNFSTTADSNIVFFGSVPAKVIAASQNQLAVTVPQSAPFQPISITIGKHTAYTVKPFNITFPSNGKSFDSTSFAPRIDLLTGTLAEPDDAAIGDLDGDGKLDIAVPNNISNTITIFRNISLKGTLWFASPINYNCKSRPTKISIADIDGDAKPELIVHYYGSEFSVFQNTSSAGNISFVPTVFDTLGGLSFERIAMADFDGDGKIDFAAPNENTSTLSIVRNASSLSAISFDPPKSFPAVMQPQSAAIGDFNGDGKPDITVSNFNYNSLSVYINTSTQGNITFDQPVHFSADDGLGSVVVADFNIDGKPDIAVGNRVLGTLTVFENSSSRNNVLFLKGKDYPISQNPYNLSTADLNGDGKQDILVANIRDNSVAVVKNSSIDSIIQMDLKVDYGTGSNPLTVSSADFDGDGKPDIAVASSKSHSISIFRNQIGEPISIDLCPTGNTTMTVNQLGTNYQWQVNKGSAFFDINEDNNYSGTTTRKLDLSAIPSLWYGYQYRCLVDGKAEQVFSLRFKNGWIGSVGTSWENPGNWSCGSVPDANTDVVIDNGNVVLNSNAFCRSIKISAGASLLIAPGFTLTITK